ncbi:MAG: sensor histidine kinase [Filifactoraceae bacterium]
MDTKLKNYRNKYLKATAFIFTVVLLTVSSLLALTLLEKTGGYISNDNLAPNYLRTNEFGSLMQTNYSQTIEAIDPLINQTETSTVENNQTTYSKHKINLKDLTFKNYSKTKNLSEVDYYFYIKYRDMEITNVGLDKILQQKYYIEKIEGNDFFTFSPKLDSQESSYIAHNPYLNSIRYWDDSSKYNDALIYIAYNDEVIEASIAKFNEAKASFKKQLPNIGICIALSLLFIIYLSLVAGRNPEDNELHPWKVDRLFGEFIIFMCGFLFISSIYINYAFYDASSSLFYSLESTKTLFIGINLFLFSIMGMFWLSLCRKFKAKPRRYMFFSTGLAIDLVIKVFKYILNQTRNALYFFNQKQYARFPVTQRIHRSTYMYLGAILTFIFFSLIFGLSDAAPLFFFFIIMLIVATFVYIKKSKENFEEINKGFDKGYRESLKAEKMRVDLITNVSHDLKTPLTSIISYTDLLKNEDMSPVAKDYVQILEQKAKRLNSIVSDLFDLSKSTSGNLNFNLEKIDLKKLIEQTYADMEDSISSSKISFVIQLPSEPVIINADGKKLYRVFQNLLDNALKYSLNGTRVYITLEVNDEKIATSTIKNISSYQMNFTESEIAERFIRGDSSRTTEGSGLGLSIAESFVTNCNGKFKLKVDGDLFKIMLSFPTVEGDIL